MSDEEPATADRASVSLFPPRVADALRKRGFDDLDTMTADQAFDEFCNWHGLMGWGETLRNALDDSRAAVKVPGQEQTP